MFLQNNNEKLGKFEAREVEGIFLGYSSRRKGYKCYNKRLQKIIECIDVVIDEACTDPKKVTSTKEDDDDEWFPTSNHNEIEEKISEATEEDTLDKEKAPSRYVEKNHLEAQILGEKESGVQTRITLVGSPNYLSLFSTI